MGYKDGGFNLHEFVSAVEVQKLVVSNRHHLTQLLIAMEKERGSKVQDQVSSTTPFGRG